MTKKTLAQQLDDITREIVLLRANGVCELCGLRKPIQDHHIWGRGGAVRWDLYCRSGVCANCHEWCTRNSGKAREKYRQIRGETWYRHTSRLYSKIWQWKEWEMKTLRKSLTFELQKLRNELR